MSTISTSGIAPSSVIRAEHVLRVINALSNNANNDILITGSLTVTGSTNLSGSLNVTGGITGSFTGSFSGNGSQLTGVTAEWDGSHNGNASITGSLTVSGSSTFTNIGPAVFSGSVTSTQGFTGSLQGTASMALSASYVQGYVLNSSTSSFVLNSQTGSFLTSTSTASLATSASYALTASYVLGGGSTTSTSSLLTTASISGQTLTFTKGDASTFNVTIPSGSSVNTGSFATTGSNTFRGNQTITGSVSITGSQSITGSVDLNGGSFTTLAGDSLMSIYSNIITIENQESPFDYTLLGQGVLSYNSASNAQQFLFPSPLTTGIKTITLPNDTGTVALTYNTATTGSNTFRGNQTINANLILSASKTMSIVGPLAETYITEGQISISPNYSGVDQATLSGGNLSLSDANGYSRMYLTNRNASNDTSSIEIHRTHFQGKSTDANSGLKAGLRVFQSVGTGSSGYINFYTSASAGFGFTSGDLDMRISTGSKIELFRDTIISGSLSQGENNNTTGLFSHAEGYSSITLGTYSHAEGNNTTAFEDYSHAEGSQTIAIGYASHAEGLYTTSSGLYSHTEGKETYSTGSYSHAEGSGSISHGVGSHAEGFVGQAFGNYSHAEGLNTQAAGDYSHAEGSFNSSWGIASHAEGSSTNAYGYYSHTEGNNTRTDGNYSHAEGLGTRALSDYQHVQGAYNLTSTNPKAFIIGNGVDDSNRSNLVYASGSQFQVTGSLNVSGSTHTVQNGFVILQQVSQSLNFIDDAAAATGGVPLGGLYRNGNFVAIRIT